jgi:hypothetical protein
MERRKSSQLLSEPNYCNPVDHLSLTHALPDGNCGPSDVPPEVAHAQSTEPGTYSVVVGWPQNEAEISSIVRSGPLSGEDDE